MDDRIEFLAGMIGVFFIVGLCVYGLVALITVHVENPQTQQLCDNISISGVDTEIRHIVILGIDTWHCFVDVNGTVVPYSRWRVVEGDIR